MSDLFGISADIVHASEVPARRARTVMGVGASDDHMARRCVDSLTDLLPDAGHQRPVETDQVAVYEDRPRVLIGQHQRRGQQPRLHADGALRAAHRTLHAKTHRRRDVDAGDTCR